MIRFIEVPKNQYAICPKYVFNWLQRLYILNVTGKLAAFKVCIYSNSTKKCFNIKWNPEVSASPPIDEQILTFSLF